MADEPVIEPLLSEPLGPFSRERSVEGDEKGIESPSSSKSRILRNGEGFGNQLLSYRYIHWLNRRSKQMIRYTHMLHVLLHLYMSSTFTNIECHEHELMLHEGWKVFLRHPTPILKSVLPETSSKPSASGKAPFRGRGWRPNPNGTASGRDCGWAVATCAEERQRCEDGNQQENAGIR